MDGEIGCQVGRPRKSLADTEFAEYSPGDSLDGHGAEIEIPNTNDISSMEVCIAYVEEESHWH